MRLNPVLKKSSHSIKALQDLAPDITFGRTNLAKIVPLREDLDTKMEAILRLENQLEGARIERDEALSELNLDLRHLREGIAAHPDFGDDSELYGRCGFVRRSERATGLTRKKSEE